MSSPTAQAESRLRTWRKTHDLTLEDVSGLTGYSVATVSRVERGERKLSPFAKVAIARRLGVSVRELFEVEPIEATDGA